MYVNYGGWMLNDQRHYAYLRKKDDNVVLIVANQFLPEKICTVDVKANNSVIIKLNLL